MAGGCTKVREAIGKVIFGQAEVIELALTAILAGGHALLVGAPGPRQDQARDQRSGGVLGLDEKRVQFTPDLMPADIVGSEVLEESEQGRRQFRFVPGPVFCQLLMADEINRASPRTQSALLQAMQEHHVTVAGVAPRPAAPLPCAGDPESDRAGRHLSAARSPARPLPACEIDVPYPDLEAERRMLFATTGTEERSAEPVFSSRRAHDGPSGWCA